jgi:hypothetical protein
MTAKLPCGLFTADAGTFCGPAALAALTGIPAKQVEDVVVEWRKQTGNARRKPRGTKCPVKAMWWSEVEPIAERLGHKATRIVTPHGKNTLNVWMRSHPTGNWIVLITGHFIAISGGWMVDTRHRDGTAAIPKKYLNSRVQCYAKIEGSEQAMPQPAPMPKVQLDLFR